MDENIRGFSYRSEDEDFAGRMRSQIKKNFKYAILSAPVIYVILLIIVGMISRGKGFKAGEFVLLAAVLFVVFFFIALGMTVSLFKDLSKLKKGYTDGIVIKKSKYRTIHDENTPSKTKYTVVIETDDGKKIKVKDRKAMAVYPHIEKGDKVRFHFGYPFPIELYDKTRTGKNICVFCGAENDAGNDTCKRCKNPMLK